MPSISRTASRGADLLRLLGQGDERLAPAGRAPLPRHVVQHLLRLHVADDHEDLVVGNVAFVIEVDDRLVRGAVEHLEISDHRMPGRMDRVDRQVQQVVHDVPPIDLVVGQFAANDFQLAGKLLGLESDVLHGIGRQLDGGHGVAGRAVDEEGRVVVGGVGIGHSAEAGDDLLDLLLAAVDRGAAGHDVFQHVAQPRAEVAAFEGAAGVLHVAADRGHGGRVVLLHDDRQAVIQRGQRHIFGQVPHAGVLRHRRLWVGRDKV